MILGLTGGGELLNSPTGTHALEGVARVALLRPVHSRPERCNPASLQGLRGADVLELAREGLERW